jgi:excisionase family DNA binding protein
MTAQRLAFSPAELATLTGLGLRTVYRRLATGEIRFNRSGRRVLIPRQELERLLTPQTATLLGLSGAPCQELERLLTPQTGSSRARAGVRSCDDRDSPAGDP